MRLIPASWSTTPPAPQVVVPRVKPVDKPQTKPEPPDDRLQRAINRLSVLDTDSLLDVIESSPAAMGMMLRDWRASREIACLDELEITAATHLHAVRELVRRSQLRVFG